MSAIQDTNCNRNRGYATPQGEGNEAEGKRHAAYQPAIMRLPTIFVLLVLATQGRPLRRCKLENVAPTMRLGRTAGSSAVYKPQRNYLDGPALGQLCLDSRIGTP